MRSRLLRTRKSLAASSPAGKTVETPPASKPWRIILRSPRQTHRLGQRLGKLLQGGEVLALFGELGTGKTSLVRGIAEGLLAEPTAVSSPTFTLIHEYRGRLRLIHTDLYHLTAVQLEDTGLTDYLDGHTVITRPDGLAAICPTGNPGMATAGTGDVLTGMVGGLLAQGLSPWDSACTATYIHGLAGDLAANLHGQASMLARDLIQQIPHALTPTTHA